MCSRIPPNKEAEKHVRSDPFSGAAGGNIISAQEWDAHEEGRNSVWQIKNTSTCSSKE
jgi:hypothetical protein